MIKTKFAVAAAISLMTSPVWAGGLLTNTNASVAFMRNFAREGAIAVDGVYFNPAGVAFLDKGWHLSLSIQNVYQTRSIESGMTLSSFTGTPYEKTPYYRPFSMNGGNEEGVKKYVGKASVPVLPSFQAALNYDRWGFQLGFSLVGGGGKASFNDGLGSFERQIALLPFVLASANQKIGASLSAFPDNIRQTFDMSTTTPGYSVQSYIHGQQYVFGLQFGSTYKIKDNLAVYGGLRFNYVYNKYEGRISDISVNIKGENTNLYKHLGEKATAAATMATNFQTQAAQADAASKQYAAAGDQATAAQYAAAAARATAAANGMQTLGQQLTGYQSLVADKELDCTQTGWGVTPIIGLDWKLGRLNIGTRVEFTSRLNIQNDTKRDDTGLFQDGVNTPNDLPGMYALGLQYEVLPTVRVMGSWHYYFDKDAKMANDKQKLLSSNTQEFLAGAEWDVTKDLTISAGGQSTRYGLGNGAYLSDMSFVTSSYSVGFGAKFKISKKASVNIAYFWTNYEHFDKSYDQTYKLGSAELKAANTDRFYRTNRVLGAGIDIDL